jgi:GAF domain-containing protein/signal transduction histidine kinase
MTSRTAQNSDARPGLVEAFREFAQRRLYEFGLLLTRLLIVAGAWMRFLLTLSEFSWPALAAWIAVLLSLTLYTFYVVWQTFTRAGPFSRRWYATQIILDTLLFSFLYVLSARSYSDLYLFYFLPFLVAAEHFELRRALLLFVVISAAFLTSYVFLEFMYPGDLPLGMALLRNGLPRWLFFLVALFVTYVRTSQIEEVRRTAIRISSHEALHERFRAVLEEATKILGVRGCKIYLAEPNRQWLRLAALTGLEHEQFHEGYRLPVTHGVAGLVFRTGKPRIENNYAMSELRLAGLSHLFGSVLEVPLKWSSSVLGVLGVFDDTGLRQFGENDRATLERLAEHVAVAIRDIEALENVQKQTKAVLKLNAAGDALLGAGEDYDEVLRVIAEHARDIALVFTSEPQYVLVALVNESGVIDFAATCPPDYLLRLKKQVVSLDIHRGKKGVVGRAVSQGDLVYVDDVFSDADYIAFDDATRSQLAIPIRGKDANNQDRVLGVLSVEHPDANGIPPEVYEPLQGLAAHAASALQNVRLIAELAKQGARAELLREWSARLSSVHDLEKLGALILEGLQEVLPHDRSTLQVLDHNMRSIVATRNVPKVVNAALTRGIDTDPLIQRAIECPDDLLVLESVVMDGDWEDLAATRDVRSWACLVLRFDRLPIALITIDHRRATSYTDDIRIALRLYASNAASVLQTAMLLEENRKQMHELGQKKEHLEVVFDYLDSQRNLAMIGLVYGESIHFAQNQLGLAANEASYIMQDPQTSPTSRDRADRIKTHMSNYLDLIRKLQEDAIDPTPARTNVQVLVDGVVRSKRLGAITVRNAFPLRGEEAFVVAPQSLLRQVFYVIIQNAVDAMMMGGELFMRSASGEVNGLPAILITVSDTGHGISPEQQATLFRATRSDGSGSRRRGTHMGLMWARSFMRSYGGDITYTTGAGGTSMTIHIPRDFQIRAPQFAVK